MPIFNKLQIALMNAILLIATLVVIVYFIRRTWLLSKDSLHPTMVIGLALLAMYVAQPSWLLISEPEVVYRLIPSESISFVLLVNLGGVIAMLMGCSKWATVAKAETSTDSDKAFQSKFLLAGVVLGSLAVTGFASGIINAGGFSVAYGQGYGGGWSDSGYLREAYWFAIPAILFISLAKTKMSWTDVLLIAVFASPLVIHGILGARRGPTASVIVTVFLARAITTGWRPKVTHLIVGIVSIGLLMLSLVAYRDVISWSGVNLNDLSGNRGLTSYATTAGSSNEFIYGGAVVLAAYSQETCYYGGRYATVIFIRPIPRSIFPSKYDFAERFFGIPNLETTGSNLGTGTLDFDRLLGWKSAVALHLALFQMRFWNFPLVTLFYYGLLADFIRWLGSGLPEEVSFGKFVLLPC